MKITWTAGTVLGVAAMLGAGAWAKPAAGTTAMQRTKTAVHAGVKTRAKAASKTHNITAAQAGKDARAKYHGKVVGKPVLQKKNGRRDYDVRLLSGKTMRDVEVNAATGKIDGARIVTAREHSAMGHKSKPVAHSAATHAAKAKKAGPRHS